MKTIRDVVEYEIGKENPIYKNHKQLYEALGMSEQAYFQLLKRNSEKFDTKTSTLKKFADKLNINVESFFEYQKEDTLSDNDVSWKRMYDESQTKIGHLLNTIQMLSLGKFRAVSTKPAYISIP